MAGERFKIGTKVYETDVLDTISLRDLMVFNRQVADMGLSITWADVERISAEMAEIGEADGASRHPEAMLMTGVVIWASRRAAGDDVTFEQAVDIPMSEIVWIEAPKDHRPSKKKGAGGSRSVQPVPSSDDEPSPMTPPTSEPRSESA
jgi:hypothetical protein